MHDIRSVREADASYIAKHLGPDSKKAIELCGVTDLPALTAVLIRHSSVSKVVTVEGQPVAIFGVLHSSQGGGSAWLMAVGDLPPLPPHLIKSARRHLQEMLKEFSFLQTKVWEGNPSHIRWVKWLGFTETGSAPYGAAGEVFHNFILENKHGH